jgi:hypothetical protein
MLSLKLVGLVGRGGRRFRQVVEVSSPDTPNPTVEPNGAGGDGSHVCIALNPLGSLACLKTLPRRRANACSMPAMSILENGFALSQLLAALNPTEGS